MPLVDDFGDAELVVDLSDEPVLGPARADALGRRARSPQGCRTSAPTSASTRPCSSRSSCRRSRSIGTGKRVGKTAVTTRLARLLARDLERGRRGDGTRRPARARARRVAADDRRARRALARRCSMRRPTTSRSRRSRASRRSAAGAPAGASPAPWSISNVAAGAQLAADLRPDVVIFDGSGCRDPAGRDRPPGARRRAAAGAGTTISNTYRRLVSDLVLGASCELRLEPCEPLDGRVAVFTAGATDVSHLDADVVHVSTNLAHRVPLADDLVDGRHVSRRVERRSDRRRRRARARARHSRRARRERRARSGVDDAVLLGLSPVAA